MNEGFLERTARLYQPNMIAEVNSAFNHGVRASGNYSSLDNQLILGMALGSYRSAEHKLSHWRLARGLRMAIPATLATGAAVTGYSIARGDLQFLPSVNDNITGIAGVSLLVTGALLVGIYRREWRRRAHKIAQSNFSDVSSKLL